MNDDEEYLISYANLHSNLFKFQNSFISKEDLEIFYKFPYYGIPQCLPANIRFFDYSKAKYFKIEKHIFSKKIFNTNNLRYVGNKKYFRYGNIFAYNVKLKSRYRQKVNIYKENIKNLKKKITLMSKGNKKICSMQIRNIPHYGHEAVFKYILNKFDLLVLNPIFGIKKKNDVSDKMISTALKFMEKKYEKKILFMPFWTNFYYGGPREALHHLSMRESLGFKFFYVGRDHAGAESIYKPLSSINLTKKFSNKFNIKSFISAGGYYCSKCDKYLIKNSCGHNNLYNISGTEFRKKIREKKYYVHADNNLQNLIKSI